MNEQTPKFQETLKRMLESPPKGNKPLNKEKEGESDAEGGRTDMDDAG